MALPIDCYIPAKPCKRGHSLRYKSSGSCIYCYRFMHYHVHISCYKARMWSLARIDELIKSRPSASEEEQFEIDIKLVVEHMVVDAVT
jgi:hypothetical protein